MESVSSNVCSKDHVVPNDYLRLSFSKFSDSFGFTWNISKENHLHSIVFDLYTTRRKYCCAKKISKKFKFAGNPIICTENIGNR